MKEIKDLETFVIRRKGEKIHPEIPSNAIEIEVEPDATEEDIARELRPAFRKHPSDKITVYCQTERSVAQAVENLRTDVFYRDENRFICVNFVILTISPKDPSFYVKEYVKDNFKEGFTFYESVRRHMESYHLENLIREYHLMEIPQGYIIFDGTKKKHLARCFSSRNFIGARYLWKDHPDWKILWRPCNSNKLREVTDITWPPDIASIKI